MKPRGVPHTFWNPGSELARLIEIISPAGFEKYFEEVAKVRSAGGSPDRAKIAEIAGKYGMTFHMEQVPELEEKYNIKLG